MKRARPIVFATPAYGYLADSILRLGFGKRGGLERKEFPDGERTEITGVSATVNNQRVVIYDDMIRTGSSLLQAAQAYRDAGAKQVFAVATHGIFPGDAFARITAAGLLDGLACTDTHPNVLGLPRTGIHVESVARMLTDYLKESL